MRRTDATVFYSVSSASWTKETDIPNLNQLQEDEMQTKPDYKIIQA